MSAKVEEFIAIAHLMRPQGRKGELLAELLTDQLDQFVVGKPLHLARADSPQPSGTRQLENHWQPTGKNAGRIVLKLSGCNSISEAELIAGMDVLVSEAELPPLEENTFYVRDLLGCTVMVGDRVAGRVIDVQFATSPDGRIRLEDAAPLLAVAPLNAATEASEPFLIPFVRAYLQQVDVAGKRVVMNLPEGLLDEASQASGGDTEDL